MGRISGYYEWDDDALTPGQKREGGLHQNLYDSAGKLRSSARFVPNENDADGFDVTETVFVPVEGRRLDEDEDELSGDVAALLASLVVVGGVVAAPHIRRWWQEKAAPAIEAGRGRWRARRIQRRAAAVAVDDGNGSETGRSLVEVSRRRPRMSSAEAQSRLLAALAARAYSDEQWRLVSDAEIVEGVSVDEVKQTLNDLPAEQVQGVIEAMVKDPP